ncbi:hypothetical protein Btru_005646 [Bulinus truncatus]|nr:hypothetical protein Btru_005646 [Bulinus truncatus]
MTSTRLLLLLVCIVLTGSQGEELQCEGRFWKMQRDQTNMCVYFHKKADSFEDARKICKSMNSHLLAPRTPGEFNVLSWSDKNVWIGLDDLKVEGRFVWHDDNSTMDSVYQQRYFLPGEPSSAKHENCIEYLASSECNTLQVLNDANCSLQRPFFCEHD